MYATLDRTEALARAVLAEIPRGSYGFTEYFEDDYISDVPVRLVVKLTARGDGTVELDYTGSDPQVRAALNLPTGGMNHHPFLAMSVVNYVVTRSEAIHINAGILRCIDLVLPQASVVNAGFPAACGMRFTTAMRVHDLILGALNRAMPGAVPVAGSGGARRHLHLNLGIGRRRTGGRRQPGLRRQRGAGPVPRRVRRRLRAGDPPSERGRRDARQGPPAVLRLARRAARPARRAATSAPGSARRRTIPLGTISASARSTAPSLARSSACGAGRGLRSKIPRHCDPGLDPGEAISCRLGSFHRDCFVATLLAMTDERKP